MRKLATIFLLGFLTAMGAHAQKNPVQKDGAGNKYPRPVFIKNPQPGYTDQARHAGVQGTIRLKVTFNADGTLGEIVYDSGSANINGRVTDQKVFAQYGLLERSIKAARKIKFTPAMKDGKPVTVIKIVKYTFTLY